MTTTISKRTLERLSLYRRLLSDRLGKESPFIFSHQLAKLVQVTSSQVRRDIMVTGCFGNPTRGYRVEDLIEAIGKIVDAEEPQNVVLVGIGKLGSALMNHFHGRRPNLRIKAAFDSSPERINRIYQGVRCYGMQDLAQVIRDESAYAAILTVPGDVAQQVANQLVMAGIRGILNFAPVPLHLPGNVYVEVIDLTTSLEKVTFFARQSAGAQVS